MPRLGCEPIPAGAVIPVGTATDGDMLYYDAGAWQLLAPGTDGEFLSLTGGLPFWTANGSGDVTGPAGATDRHIAIYNGVTGKIIQDSLVHITSAGQIQPATDDAQALGASTLAWTKVWSYGFYGRQIASAVAPAAGWATFGAFWVKNDATTTPRFTNSSGTEYLIAYDPTTTLGDLTYRGASLLTRLAIGSTGQKLTVVGGAPAWATQTITQTIVFVISGGGSTITTGVKGDLPIDYNCTITGVTLLADQSGSIVVDLWVDTYANYPPTVGDSICGAAKPTIVAATKSQDTTLTGWDPALLAGDTIRFNVDSATSITQVTVALTVTRTI